MSDLDYSEAVAALNDYYRWRLGGGFQPFHVPSACPGDAFADRTANRLADALSQVDFARD